MSNAGWLTAHRRSLLFLVALIVAGGIASALRLPVALFPNVQFPMVAIDLEAGDRPAERMAAEITAPVEEAVRGVPGVLGLRSATSRGSAEITASFAWGEDMEIVLSRLEAAVGRSIAALPAGASFAIRRKQPNLFPVLAYSLTSATRSPSELRRLAQYDLRPRLSACSGVASIDVQGGATQEYHVLIDQARLQAFDLSAADVGEALAAANVLAAAGRFEDHGKLYLVMVDSVVGDLDGLKSVTIRSGAGGIVHLGDIATVERGVEPAWTRCTADGRDAVLLQVFQQPGGNTVALAKALKQTLADSAAWLPADVRIANWYDQSELILASADSVRDAVIVGVVLAAVVLLAFLRNLKITLIAALVVPVVLASTSLLLSLLGMSFNIMTLGGMAAAVGLIVDDAIVMVEHIVRRIRAAKCADQAGVLGAASEFTRPLLGSSLSTIIIFAPLAFLSGVTGAFFKALSLTMAASLVISYLVAWLVVPLVAAAVLRERDGHGEDVGRFQRRLNRGYERLMRAILPRRWLGAVVVIALAAVAWTANQRLGTEFMPHMDEGGFILDYLAEPGTSLAETDRLLGQVESILHDTPEVDTFSRRTGLQLGGGLTEANAGDFFVRLKHDRDRGMDQVMDDVRQRIHATVPHLDIDLAQLMEDIIGDLTGNPHPIEIKLFCDDGAVLGRVVDAVGKSVTGVAGVTDVANGLVSAGDALQVVIDRDRAAIEGLSVEAIQQQVDAALTGVVATRVQRGPAMIAVRTLLPKSERATVGDLAALPIRVPDGHVFPLSRVARLVPVSGQPQILREDFRRMGVVTGRISGRDLGSTIADIQRALAKPGLLPRGVTYRLGGTFAQERAAAAGLTWVLAAAVALVFLLLLYLYESFRIALAMLLTTSLSLSAVLAGLWATGMDLNITARMGMTMVIGIVTEVAIFFCTEHAALAHIVDPIERLVQAGANRMRPIAMTTAAAILALLPLALGIGQGSQMQQPLAIAIISGLLLQLPLALVVLPMLLVMLGAAGGKRVSKAPTAETI